MEKIIVLNKDNTYKTIEMDTFKDIVSFMNEFNYELDYHRDNSYYFYSKETKRVILIEINTFEFEFEPTIAKLGYKVLFVHRSPMCLMDTYIIKEK